MGYDTVVKNRPQPLASAGFSLVELSIVLVIVSALLTMLVSGMLNVARNSAESATRSSQGAIRDTLIGYLRANGRLPCPDIGPDGAAGISSATLPDGLENRSVAGNATSPCSSGAGVLPYATLGLTQEAALDGWGNYFTYVVSNNTALVAPPRDWTISTAFRSGSVGAIEVINDANVAIQAAVLIISHGATAAGAFTVKGTQGDTSIAGANEQANYSGCPVDAGSGLARCFSRDLTDNAAAAGGRFDDIVMAVSADTLKNPLFTQGVRLPPAADWQKQCADLRDQLIANGLANRVGITPLVSYGIAPAATINAKLIDPYSANPHSCVIPVGSQIVATSTGTLCAATSMGVDGAVGGGDDLVCTITAAELRSVFAKTGF
jgi:prepilin-type N-terminal cleavage/methylation domain-containing protein